MHSSGVVGISALVIVLIFTFFMGFLCGYGNRESGYNNYLIEKNIIEWKIDSKTGDRCLVFVENGEKFGENK